MPKLRLPDRSFEWNALLAYAVGLIATDGCLSSDGRHVIMRSADLQLLHTFKKCLGISNKITETFNDGYAKKRAYRIQPSMVQFYRWLLKIGLTPAKSHTIGAINIPNKYFRDFLRGHLDGDGSITIYQDRYNTYKNPKYIYQRLWLRFISASKKHIEWLQNKVNELTGVDGHRWTSKQKDKKHVSMSVLKFGKRDSIRMLNWMYYEKNIPCLLRKYEKAKPFLAAT